jgi:hypothetical protein
MSRTTIDLPFVRMVTMGSPGARNQRTLSLVENLPVTLRSPATAALPLAQETFEDGCLAQVRVRIGDLSYQPYGGYRNASAFEQAERVEADLRRRFDAYGDRLPDGSILSDGREEQEETRALLESQLVLADGVLYQPAALPNIELSIEAGGRVSMAHDQPLSNPDVRSWMRFSLDRATEADHMASFLIMRLNEYGPKFEWRKLHPYGIVRNHFTKWACAFPSHLEGVAFSSGGTGTVEERSRAFAEEYVGMVRPHIGHYPVAAVRLYADVREGLARGSCVRWILCDLAADLAEKSLPGTMDEARGLDVAVQSFALQVRLTRHEGIG